MQIKYCLTCGCQITEEQPTHDLMMSKGLMFVHADYTGCQESIKRMDNDEKYGRAYNHHQRVTYAGGLHFQ